MLLVLASVVKV